MLVEGKQCSDPALGGARARRTCLDSGPTRHCPPAPTVRPLAPAAEPLLDASLGERQIRQGDGTAFLPDAKAKVELAPFGHKNREARFLGLATALLAGAAGTCRDYLSHLALHHDRKLVDRARLSRPACTGVGNLAARQDVSRNPGSAATAPPVALLRRDCRDGRGAHPISHRGGDRT